MKMKFQRRAQWGPTVWSYYDWWVGAWFYRRSTTDPMFTITVERGR